MAIMASNAEMRRFLSMLDVIKTERLIRAKEALLELKAANQLDIAELGALGKIEEELNKRGVK